MKLSDVSAVSVVCAHLGAIRELLRDARGGLLVGDNVSTSSAVCLADAQSRAMALHRIFGTEETARIENAVLTMKETDSVMFLRNQIPAIISHLDTIRENLSL